LQASDFVGAEAVAVIVDVVGVCAVVGKNCELTRSASTPVARRIYQTRVFDSRVIMPDEIERIHKDLLQFERIEAISDPMRELVEDLWPELVHKLPPRRSRA